MERKGIISWPEQLPALCITVAKERESMEIKNDKQIKIVCDSNAPGSDFRIIDGELQQYIGIDRIVYVPEGVTRNRKCRITAVETYITDNQDYYV